jgi:hypothetical protein
MVKEVMRLSGMLEVRDDKVRLAGAEAKRWVLPDAKTSTFPPDPITDTPAMTASTPDRDVQSLSDAEMAQIALGVSGLANAGLGMEDMNGGTIPIPKYAPGGVENALMKSSIPPSSSASVTNGGDESVDKGSVSSVTPATSMSGDGDAEKVESR